MLTREWPPDIYGGAGVHVEHLAAQLRRKIDVDVHCFGEPRDDGCELVARHREDHEFAAADDLVGVEHRYARENRLDAVGV